MAKKNWVSVLKRFFKLETHSNREKDKKRRRWVFAKLKIKRLPSITAPSPSREKIDSEAEEDQRNGAIVAEVVRLTNSPQSTHQCEEETQELSPINIQPNASPSIHGLEREIQALAVTKIQAAFRGYLARKALRALKGLVRLQAIIRGRAVRRQAITTLKRLQSIVDIQSQVCARRCQMVEGTLDCHENKEFPHFRGKDIKINSNSQRRWDDSILTKQEAYALFSSKREAAIKRERIKEYSFTQRRSTESEQNKENGRLRYWLEQWVDTQLAKREDLQNAETIFSSGTRNGEEFKGRQLKLRNLQKQYHTELFNSPIHAPRRSFHHRKQHSIGDDNPFTGSPVFPTYMAATESARAKARSLSSPRLRPMSLDAYSETNSPYKHKLSPISSVNSEVRSCGRIGNNPSGGFSQRSPCLKGGSGPVKSSITAKDLSFNSECTLPNWDRLR